MAGEAILSEEEWMLAAVQALETLKSIRSSQYCMPAPQYGMMYQSINRIQNMWTKYLETKRAHS